MKNTDTLAVVQAPAAEAPAAEAPLVEAAPAEVPVEEADVLAEPRSKSKDRGPETVRARPPPAQPREGRVGQEFAEAGRKPAGGSLIRSRRKVTMDDHRGGEHQRRRDDRGRGDPPNRTRYGPTRAACRRIGCLLWSSRHGITAPPSILSAASPAWGGDIRSCHARIDVRTVERGGRWCSGRHAPTTASNS